MSPTSTTTTKKTTPINIPRIASNGTTTTQACAACKYQRRKCAPDCILAPYFPHDRQQQFLNAHKLFGVSNITKIIRNLDPPEKDAAMRTIIIQSDVRAKDPVGGCCRIIRDLHHQILYTKTELDMVLHQLAICRAQVQQQQQHLQMQETHETLACDIVNPDPFASYNSMSYNDYLQPHDQDQQYVVDDQHQLQQDVNAWALQDSTLLSSSSSSGNIVKHNLVSECDEHAEPVVEVVGSERHEHIKFEPEELVETRFVASTQLLISS